MHHVEMPFRKSSLLKEVGGREGEGGSMFWAIWVPEPWVARLGGAPCAELGARWGLEHLDLLNDIWASELTSQ